MISNSSGLQRYIENLSQSKQMTIALDTEANNHRYAYGQQLCLVQVYDGTSGIIIDPLKIRTGTLRNLFENRDILKIMYDAPNDISLLVNSLGVTINSILDLRPAVELLDYAKKDLHSVINAELGVELKDKKKYQKMNWLRRPLPAEALEYALNDVRYLFRLKDAIIDRIYRRQLFDLFILRNIRIQNKDYFIDPKESYRRVKGFRGLDDGCKPLFQRLYAVREKYAKQANMPSANIVSNNLLLNIASGTQTLEDISFPRRLKEDIRNGLLLDFKQITD